MNKKIDKWMYYFEWIAIVVGIVVVLWITSTYKAEASDNRTRTSGGFPIILDEDKEWPSQLLYDTIGACFQGTIQWILLSNPALFGQIPTAAAQRQMVEHCFCVMDKIRKEHEIKEYRKKVFDKEFIGNLFMVKATECVGEWETLPSFFMKMPNDNETITEDNELDVKKEESEDSQEQLPSENPIESEVDSKTIFQG